MHDRIQWGSMRPPPILPPVERKPRRRRRSFLLSFLGFSFASGVVLFLVGLQSIPSELYEAADLEGASAWQKFRLITVPMLNPTIMVVLILSTIGGFSLFVEPYVMTGGGPMHSSEVLATAIYFDGFQKLRFGYASAEAVVLFLVLFVVSAFYVRRSLSNVT